MLEAMLNHVEAGYTANGNPYHNNMHACDVLQTTHYFISQTGLAVSPSIKFISNNTKLGLSEKHTKFGKKNPHGFDKSADLLSKRQNHE